MTTSRRLLAHAVSAALLSTLAACGGGAPPDTRPGTPCVFATDCPGVQRCEDRRCVPIADGGTDAGPDGGTDGGSDGGSDGGTIAGDLVISATTASRTAAAGEAVAPVTFSLSNDGGALLHFALSCTLGTATPSSGTIAAGAFAPISVALAASTTAGVQTGTCTATTSDGTGSPKAIAITVTITPDVTAPSVALSAPVGGSVVFGTTQLTATATDAVGVTSVQFQLDGANLGAAQTAGPYSLAWDTTAATNGVHSIAARATDGAGNARTSTAVSVTVSNGGHVTLSPATATASAAAGNVPAPVSFTLGNDGSASLAFTVACDMGAVPTPSAGNVAIGATAPVSVALPAFTTAGPKTVICTANAPGGPKTFTVTVSVGADTTPPAVAITSPSSGTTVSGTVALAVTATDGVGVDHVEYYVDGALVATATGPSFGANWSSWTLANGNHAITAKAYDAANNVGTSAGVTVTTANGVLGMPTTSANVSTTTNHASTATFTLTNTGGASVSYAISCSSGASASPASGSIAASGAPATITMNLPIYTTAGGPFTSTCTTTSTNSFVASPLVFTATATVAQSTSSVTFARPTAAAAKVCARILLSATTTDPAVAKIRYDLVDGTTTTALGTATSGPNFQFLWDSTTVTNKTYTLTANGLTAAGAAQGGPDSVTITIGNGDGSSGACTSVHLTLGLPETTSTTDASNVNHYLGLLHQYSHSFNSSLKMSNWTAWELNSLWSGTQSRTDLFRYDDTLPANLKLGCTTGGSVTDGCPQAEDYDYSEPVYDRGHMCPSADRTVANGSDNQNTFYLSNMVPQHPNNNQGPWDGLETVTRTAVGIPSPANGKTAFIMSGPLVAWPSQPFPTTHYVSRDGYKNGLVVPTATWKVVVILDNIGMGPQDVTTDPAHTRVIAVIVPNCWTADGNGFAGCPYTNPVAKTGGDWPKYCTTVADIEARTGLTFFSEVPAAIRSVLKTTRDASCCVPGSTGSTACYQ